MNKARLKLVADAIKAHPDNYEQDTWGYGYGSISQLKECGSVCCVAGFAVALDGKRKVGSYMVSARAQAFLDLTVIEARDMFSGAWSASWWKMAGLEKPDDERMFFIGENKFVMLVKPNEAHDILYAIADGKIEL